MLSGVRIFQCNLQFFKKLIFSLLQLFYCLMKEIIPKDKPWIGSSHFYPGFFRRNFIAHPPFYIIADEVNKILMFFSLRNLIKAFLKMIQNFLFLNFFGKLDN